MLFRAGRWSYGYSVNASSRRQALPAKRGRSCFLLQLGAYGDALGGGARHLVISAGLPRQGWRSAVRDRMWELDARLVPFVDSMRCELNGKEVAEDSLTEDLHNAVLRCCSGGLLGGARKSKACQALPAAGSSGAPAAERDFEAMNRVELRTAAKELGVRQHGVSVAELKDACKRAAGAAAKEACEEAEPEAGSSRTSEAERDFDAMNRAEVRKVAKGTRCASTWCQRCGAQGYMQACCMGATTADNFDCVDPRVREEAAAPCV